VSVVNMNDGMGIFQRADSLQRNDSRGSSIHIGIVTAVSSSTNTAFVRIPAINDGAELGPYKCLELFTRSVETPVKQTLSVTTGTADGVTVVTSVALSSTTTDIQGVYGNLNLPSVGQRVLVVLINDSLDQGVLVGKL
jgi:hypothetical protein